MGEGYEWRRDEDSVSSAQRVRWDRLWPQSRSIPIPEQDASACHCIPRRSIGVPGPILNSPDQPSPLPETCRAQRAGGRCEYPPEVAEDAGLRSLSSPSETRPEARERWFGYWTSEVNAGSHLDGGLA
ncbi:uncharacterized protein N7482_003210 [Penicillium canariense]|uniref:Uncharacterized protein n=1 Tax=Penicillium canariense TaxID=189055 RepID=A0A9W9I488_9EURO|nr:uncharacterized protein N7482_003210 [Penicillium canariense]KAJ5167616.1 hypothetical protein N7482_003210 [Penicillium canariense]